MEVTRDSLKENYKDKSTSELVEISLNNLTPLAREVIDEVLDGRSDRDASKAKIEMLKQDIKHKLDVINKRKVLIASADKRLLGQAIDGVISVSFIIILSNFGDFGIWLGVMLFVSYLLLADGLFNGRSIGKIITKTRVVVEVTGKPCGFFRSFVRNVALSVLGIFDWIFILGNDRKRLGDMLAGTIVVNVHND